MINNLILHDHQDVGANMPIIRNEYDQVMPIPTFKSVLPVEMQSGIEDPKSNPFALNDESKIEFNLISTDV